VSRAGSVLVLAAVLAAGLPLQGAAEPAACDVIAAAATLAGNDPDADPVGAREARRDRVTRDRHADVALAEIGGKVRPVPVARLLDEQFVRYDPAYRETREKNRARLDALKLRLDAAQLPAGHPPPHRT